VKPSAPDGNRILALVPTEDARAASADDQHFVFVQHFFDELRRRAPLPEEDDERVARLTS
jgi:hypothetical protein